MSKLPSQLLAGHRLSCQLPQLLHLPGELTLLILMAHTQTCEL